MAPFFIVTFFPLPIDSLNQGSPKHAAAWCLDMVYIHLSGSKVEVVVGIPETVLAQDRVGCVIILKASWFSCHFM